MATTAVQQKFVQLFTGYMARHESYQALADFIGGLKLEELGDCLSSYFDVSTRYAAGDRNSLRIFFDLSAAALERGDVYFALRYEALIHSKGTRWFAAHAALDGKQKSSLAAKIKRKKGALSFTQRRFLQLFEEYMKSRQDKALSDFVFKLKVQQQYDCLLVYIEASTLYPDDDRHSLRIFFALASLVLAKSQGYTVAKIAALLEAPGGIWNRRYKALEPREREELKRWIAKNRKGVKAQADAAPTDGATRPKAPRTSIQKKFLEAFHKHMVARRDDKAISELIFKLNFQQLRECLVAYLEASTRYADDDRFSLVVFFGIASLVIAKGDAYYALKFEHLVRTDGTLWAKRYQALEPRQQIELSKQIADRKRSARLIDELKLAYFQKNHKDPDLKALQAFEAADSPEQRKLLLEVLDRCGRKFRLHDVAGVLKCFDDFGNLLQAQRDSALLITMLKWCREARDVDRPIRDELYWYGVTVLFLYAVRLRPVVYQRGFSDEEMRLLLGVDSQTSPYFNDFEYRLEYVVHKRKGGPEILEIAKAHAALIAFAEQHGIRLVPMAEAVAVRRLVETLRTTKPKSIDALRIPVHTRFGSDTVSIGQTIGDIFIVWWDGKQTAYIEVNGLDRVLFSVDTYVRLSRIYEDDAFYGTLYRNTKHLLILIPAFFEALGYLPDLVTGGFSGLVKAVIVNYVAGEVSSRAFGDSTAGNLLTNALLTAATSGRPKLSDADALVEAESHQLARAQLARAAAEAAEQTQSTAARTMRHVGDPLAAKASGAADLVDLPLGKPARPGGVAEPHAGTTAGAGDAPPARTSRPEHKAFDDAVAAHARSIAPPSRMLPAPKISASAELTSIQTGIDAYQAQAIGEIVDIRFTKMRGFSTAWNRIATANAERIRAIHALFETNLSKREIAEQARSLFDDLRTQFWSYVGRSNDLAAREIRDQLRHAGFQVFQDGTAPSLRVMTHQGMREIRLDVDHIAELGQEPAKAFSSGNFQLTPSRENRIVLNQYHSRDPHLPDARLTAGNGTSRAGKLIGDPQYKGSSPIRGLLAGPGDSAIHEAAAADVRTAIEEAFRRLEQAGVEETF